MSEQEQILSVEIFRDADRRDLSTEAAEAGVEHLRRLVTGLEIVRTTRLLKLVKQPSSQKLKLAAIRWRRLEADMNIIVTDRELIGSEGQIHYGASAMGGEYAVNAVIVDIERPRYPNLTTAHELGHSFHLKTRGETWDEDGHCRKSDCLMYPYEDSYVEGVRVGQKGLKKYLERYGYRKAEYQAVDVPVASEFCDECTEQLAKNSFFMKEVKLGNAILPEWM